MMNPIRKQVLRISRNQAEELLQRNKKRKFVIRAADEESSLAVEELQHANRCLIQHYLLTYRNQEGNISEKLLLHTKRGWTVYQDEPNLQKGRYFSRFKDVVKKGLSL